MDALHDVLRDLRHGLRDLRRRPGFTLAAVATLALGLGVNVLVFSLVDHVLLRPLPYRDAERVVEVWNAWDEQPRAQLAMPELGVYREATSFAAIAGFSGGSFDLAAGGDAERIAGVYAGAEVFEVLAVEPVLGRLLTAQDDRPGAPPVVVLSRELWTRRFAADPGLLGRTIRLDGIETTVVGILPAGVRLPSDHRAGTRPEVWLPLHAFVPAALAENWGMHFLQAVARLDAGLTLESAQAEIDIMVRRLVASNPAPESAVGSDSFRVVLRPARDEVVGPVRRPLHVLLGAVVLVLTIACANVANLELARAQSRRREGALRAALGASPGRLIRQHLVESATLAALGGAAGLALAAGGLELVVAAAPAGVPRLDEVALDGRVLLFGLAASAITTIACGLLPALRASRVDPAAELRGAAGGSGDRVEAGFRRPLIALEVALAVILAIGAGLLARTLWNLGRVDPGYRVDSILALDLAPPETAYPGGAPLDGFFRRVRSEIEALPGIERAGAVSHLPLGSRRGDWNFYPEDRAVDPRSPAPRGDWQVATPGYFETLGIAVVEGRGIAETDDAQAPLVLLVNQALVRRYWADRSPVGVRVRLGGNDANPYATIAGVVADVRHAALDREPVPELYLPLAQAAAILGRAEPRELTVTVRTAGDPAAAAVSIRSLMARLDPDLPVANVRTLAQVRARSLSLQRFATAALGGFAALALALGAVGVFGVISYLTLGRRRELGIRMALGAERRGIFVLVVGQGLRPALVGVAIGIGAALGLTRLLDALLFEVEPADAVTYLAVAALFLAVAALASWAPARRASRIDPAAVLRE